MYELLEEKNKEFKLKRDKFRELYHSNKDGSNYENIFNLFNELMQLDEEKDLMKMNILFKQNSEERGFRK